MSRTVHHSRHTRRQRYAAIDGCCDLPGHINPCTAAGAEAGASVDSYVDAALTDLRFPTPRHDAEVDGRQIPQVVRCAFTIRSYAKAYPNYTDAVCNQLERAERARVRDELHALVALANTACGCDDDCDGLTCTDRTAVSRVRRSAAWIVH